MLPKSRTFVVPWVILVGVAAAQDRPDERSAIPSDDRLQEAAEAMRALWPGPRPTRPDDLSQRASLILDYIAGGKVTEGSALQYAMLREACECGASAGSAVSALTALDGLCATFAVDSSREHLELLTTLDETSKKDGAARSLIAARARRLFVDTLASRNPEAAGDVMELVKRSKEARWWRQEARTAQRNLDALKRDPDDAVANRAAALYFLAQDGNWSAARPYLERLDIPALRYALGPESASLTSVQPGVAFTEAARQVLERTRTSESTLLADFLYERALWLMERSLRGVLDEERAKLEAKLEELREEVDASREYLLHLEEDDVETAPLQGAFIKGGWSHNKERPLQVAGVHYERSIALHAASNGRVFLRYKLKGKRRHWLRGMAAISDSASGRRKGAAEQRQLGAATFEVYANDRIRWRSDRIVLSGESSPFCVDVSSGRDLELRITCDGPNNHAHTVWVDPYLLK